MSDKVEEHQNRICDQIEKYQGKCLIIYGPFSLLWPQVWDRNWRVASFFITRYTSKWPKTAVTEIGSRDLTCIQTSKWPQYFHFRFGPFWSLNACQVTWPYLCHSSFGSFWGISRIATRITEVLFPLTLLKPWMKKRQLSVNHWLPNYPKVIKSDQNFNFILLN